MTPDEIRQLLAAHHLTAYDIERQTGYVTQQAIMALLDEIQQAARYEALVSACRQFVAAKNAWREFLAARRLETDAGYDQADQEAQRMGLSVAEWNVEGAIRQALHDLQPPSETQRHLMAEGWTEYTSWPWFQRDVVPSIVEAWNVEDVAYEYCAEESVKTADRLAIWYRQRPT